jgi:1-acyl-sn-glycerol-3-phosphate acyltransferase
MQNIVIAEPYRFVPPVTGTFWTYPLRWWLPGKVRRSWGVEWPQFRGLDRLRASLRAGHGVVLAPNHCRPCDPLVMGLLCIALSQPCHIMASWHLFKQGRFQRWLMRAAGAFSVWREGLDREALRTATQILVDARRPLILFAEGIVSRSNDRLGHMMDGTAFIARSAARQRAKADPPGKVVVHPVFLRYRFGGDLRRTVEPVLSMIETRIGWQPQTGRKLVERVGRLGEALLTVKEVEYFGHAQCGPIAGRLPRLIDRVLEPLELEYLSGKSEPVVIERVKKLRSAIVPGLADGTLTPDEAARRWRQLADCYFAQQLACYPADYLAENLTAERILETVERYEEDLTDEARVHRPLRVTITVDEAIEVAPERPRGGGADPLMVQLRERLEGLLAATAAEGTPWTD